MSGITEWWGLCAREIGRIEVWAAVLKEEGKSLPEQMEQDRKCLADMMAFFDRVEANRPAVERALGSRSQKR